MLAGLFEHPYVDLDEAERDRGHAGSPRACDRSGAAIDRPAAKTATALPFDRAKLKTLAVVGPNAQGVHLGGYSVSTPAAAWTSSPASRTVAGPDVKVVYAEGVRITERDANWNAKRRGDGRSGEESPADPDAAAAAREAEAIVLIIGTNESTSREAWSDDHLGDVADLSLTSQQDELVDA